MKRNWIGDEDSRDIEKINWIESTFNKEQYRFISAGFIYEDYYVEFFDPAHQTLYDLRFTK